MGSGQRPQLCTSSVFRTIEALKYMDFMFNVSGDLRSCQQLSCIEDPSILKRNEIVCKELDCHVNASEEVRVDWHVCVCRM